MDSFSPDFAPARLSSNDLGEHERVPVWREFFGRKMLLTDLEPTADAPFRVDVTLRSIPDLTVGSALFSPMRLLRTPDLVADGNDDLCLIIHSTGCSVSQNNKEIEIGAGNAFLLTSAEASKIESPAEAHFRCIHIRRAAIEPLVADLDGAVMRSIPADNEALQHLLGYIELLKSDRPMTDPYLARLASVHLRDLMALLLGVSRDTAVVANGRGLRAARVRAIKRFIDDNLGRRDLTVGSVAARMKVTPRYVQRLFESEGTTFSEFVLAQRLGRAYRLLTDPRHAGKAVGHIAHETGFGDISYFNRCFRRRFGATPTSLRSAG